MKRLQLFEVPASIFVKSVGRVKSRVSKDIGLTLRIIVMERVACVTRYVEMAR